MDIKLKFVDNMNCGQASRGDTLFRLVTQSRLHPLITYGSLLCGQVMCRRVMHRQVMRGRVMYGRVMCRRVMRGRVMYGRMIKIKAFKFLPMVISLKPTILTTTYASSCSLSTVLNVASSLQQTQHILSIDRLIIHSPPPLPDPSLNPQSISFLLNSSSPLSLRLHSGDTLVASQHHESP
ncbi:hypothetical protein DY000_02034515 [Brassica cretica]|uniref:Uncharacterized protein n=1 Tax=Brassica cretica TaxID=69181 RepID=A0ABQ7DZ89_BRACR|nr:hypothetical protein DY000_02034515 [Brassica cretica]